MDKALFKSFLILFVLLNNSLLSLNVKLGSKCALRNTQTGLLLAVSNFPVAIVDPDNSGDFFWQSGVYLSVGKNFDALWLIKKEHLDGERWNFNQPDLLKNNSIIRFESCATGGNLFPIIIDGKMELKTGQKFNLGLGSLNNSSNLKIAIVKLGAEDIKPDANLVDSQVVYLSFSIPGKDEQLVMVDKEKQLLYLKPYKECKAQELLNAQWTLELNSVDYFTSEYVKPLESMLKNFEKNSKFKQLQSSSVSQVSAFTPTEFKDDSFLFSEIRLPDLEAHLGLLTIEAKKTNKALTRLNQICWQSATSAWGVSNVFKLVKFDLTPNKAFSEVVLDQEVHQVACSKEKVFVRIGKDVFEVAEYDSEKSTLKLSKDPVLTDVIFVCASETGDLFFIDSKYSIFKKSSDKKGVQIFQYNPSIFPPFVRLDVDQEGKTLLATTAQGKVFIIKNDFKSFVFSGLEFCLSSSLTKNKVVFACQNVSLQGGSCFVVPLEELLKIGGNQVFLAKTNCSNLRTLTECVKYFAGLFFKDSQATEDLILWLDKKLEDFSKEKTSQSAKDFYEYFKNGFLPVANLLSLSSQAKNAISRIEGFFVQRVVGDGDLKARIEALERENKALRESLKRAGEIIKTP